MAKSLPDDARGAGDTGSIPGEPDGLQFMELQRVGHNGTNLAPSEYSLNLLQFPK